MPHITEISEPTRWKPGQSGDPNDRPVGPRQAFSAGATAMTATVFFLLAGGHADGLSAISSPRIESSPHQRQRDGAVWRS